MKNRGQALIILLVVIPLLLLIFGLIARTGAAALAHDRIENHCNKKILDALEVQGRALTVLGKINPFARAIILSRRAIDPLANAGVVYFIPIQQGLYRAQSFINRAQKFIEKEASIETLITLSTPVPKDFAGKIKESYKPQNPKLYIEAEKLYQNEEGPPLQPDKDFKEKQSATGSIKIFTEKFLAPWRNLKADDMKMICKAKISMEQLEDKWQAQLTQAEVRR
jgi:hypothetical protein